MLPCWILPPAYACAVTVFARKKNKKSLNAQTYRKGDNPIIGTLQTTSWRYSSRKLRLEDEIKSEDASAAAIPIKHG